MLQYVKLQTSPEVIVVPATAAAALLEAAKAPAAAAIGAATVDGEADGAGEVLVQLQRPSMFTYDKVGLAARLLLMANRYPPAAKHRLCLKIAECNADALLQALKMIEALAIRPQQQVANSTRHRVTSGSGISRQPAQLINLSAQQQVAALGALLAVLLQQQASAPPAASSILAMVQ